jgi:predicted RND superfamily exporter protein
MINRINQNRAAYDDCLSPSERRNDATVFHQSSNRSPDRALSKVESVIRKSPVACLVVALTAGLALGVWVKR